MELDYGLIIVFVICGLITAVTLFVIVRFVVARYKEQKAYKIQTQNKSDAANLNDMRESSYGQGGTYF